MSLPGQFFFWERTNIEDFGGIGIGCYAWFGRGFGIGKAGAAAGFAFEGEGMEEGVDLGCCC